MNKKTVDVRGLACPIPIIKTSVALREAQRGEVFEILADDRGFKRDIVAWCEKTRNTLEEVVDSGEQITARIVKG